MEKKNKRKKRLAISITTIRQLSNDELSQAVGASGNPACSKPDPDGNPCKPD
jgi:hypothetical protein